MSDHYPSEPVLDFFKGTSIKKYGLDKFIGVIEGEWWAADWGFKKTKRGRKLYLQLHTGGWSGNEDIINSLERNKWFWIHLNKEMVGGHYWFRFELKTGDKP